MAVDRFDRLAGALIGTAVGDAVGLPREGLSPARATKLFGPPPLGHRLVLGRGLCSDDTEHACMTAQALLASGADADLFARSLAWRLRLWFLGLPAGIGFATLRAIVKLWVGFPPSRAGVRSAGNGPAMRAPVLGAALGGEPLRAIVAASTALTHRDDEALEGARLVALAAHHAARSDRLEPQALLAALRAEAQGPLAAELAAIDEALRRGASVPEFAAERGLGRGVTGWVRHTVPAALYAVLRHPGDFRAAVEAVICLGGDADTTAAIVGGIAGASVGVGGIPGAWIDGVAEWPRSIPWMRELAGRLAVRFPDDGSVRDGPGPLPLAWPGLAVRNPLFLAIVLLHGFRRLLPPY